MALKYVCDYCEELAEWVIRLEEVGPENQIHVITQADVCSNDLSQGAIEVAKIEEGTHHGEGWEFHTIHIDMINQDEAAQKDIGI